MKSKTYQEYTVPNLTEFREQWKRWWISLQPPWRIKKKWPLARRGPINELASLNVAGGEGLFLAIATLSLWGTTLRPHMTNTARKEFHQAVDDVVWVMIQTKKLTP